jgi:hypothetical protein
MEIGIFYLNYRKLLNNKAHCHPELVEGRAEGLCPLWFDRLTMTTLFNVLPFLKYHKHRQYYQPKTNQMVPAQLFGFKEQGGEYHKYDKRDSLLYGL